MTGGAIAAFTARGARLCASLCAALPGNWRGYAPPHHCFGPLAAMEGGVNVWAAQQFYQVEALVFVGAAGVAVRAIAPHLESKGKDPAVICVDERGEYVIPLLPGYIGGANRLTEQIAELCGGIAVVTATAQNGVFSIDGWAAENGCVIPDTGNIKAVSSALLDGSEVGFFSRFPVDGPLPAGFSPTTGGSVGVCISLYPEFPFQNTLWLVPRCLWVGVGCRRDVPSQVVEDHILGVLRQMSQGVYALAGVATIDRKAQEPALLDFCRRFRLPLRAYSPKELGQARGSFQGSPLVQTVTGVDNVCERAAALAGNALIVPKTAGPGVTAAVSASNWRACFADGNGV